MLTKDIKRTIDNARNVLVGKIPNPQAQIEQITIAMIYKFMDDMDLETVEFGGEREFFTENLKEYAWSKLMSKQLGNEARMNLYTEALEKLPLAKQIPELFRNIFKGAYLPFRDGQTLSLFLKEINDLDYNNSENLGNGFEYLLSIMGSQGDAGQFRTPRHIIDFIVDVVNPTKDDTILDPACGTAGFLISAYKHIKKTAQDTNIQLNPTELNNLAENIQGYDISPDMVKLALVNMYLHKFKQPKIYEYDTLTNQTRWDNYFDVILANPPFMTPKGGIKPHDKFSIKANRSEVLFVDYIMEHLNSTGKAGIIVPEGIVFQSANAYKDLRKKLVDENYLYAVVSLPSGIFQPYSGVKTSILLLDRQLAKKTDKILFVEIKNDGYDLGAQRREIDKNDLPQVTELIQQWQTNINKCHCEEQNDVAISSNPLATIVEKSKLSENGEYNLTASRYKETKDYSNCKWDMVKLGDVVDSLGGLWTGKNEPFIEINVIRNTNFTNIGNIDYSDVAKIKAEKNHFEKRKLQYGDLIIEKSGGSKNQPVGRVVIFKNTATDYSYSNFTALLRVNNKNVNPFYLHRILCFIYTSGITERYQTYTGGIRNLQLKQYLEQEIPLPPLEVQQEIVKELDGYQAVIDGAQKVVDNWKPTLPINPNWQKVKLSDFVNYSQGIQVDLNLQSKEPQEGYDKFLRIENYTQKSKDFRYIPKNLSKGKYVTEEDIVIVRYGATAGFIGKGYKGVLANNLFMLNIKSNQLDKDYLYYSLIDDKISSFIKSQTFGGGMPALSFKIMDMVEFYLPPLQEQQDIVAKIEEEEKAVEECKKLIKLHQAKIDTKIKSIWGDTCE